MPEPVQSSLQFYLNWTKERIEEMDATLASLASTAAWLQADSKRSAEQLIAGLKKRRDEFSAAANKQAEAHEAAWQSVKAQLESQWQQFEAQIKTYFETVGKQAEQQQAAFRDVAAAQAKAWRRAADTLREQADKVAAARRVDIDALLERLKVEAADAEAQLQKLKQAGSQSWASLSAALADSRKRFDQATREAWEAVKRAASPKT